MAHGLELMNELPKVIYCNPQFTLDALWMTIQQFLNPPFTWKNGCVIRLFDIEGTYNLDDSGDNYCEENDHSIDNVPLDALWTPLWMNNPKISGEVTQSPIVLMNTGWKQVRWISQGHTGWIHFLVLRQNSPIQKKGVRLTFIPICVHVDVITCTSVK